MHRYILLVFIFIVNIGANTLMEPTSKSEDLYDGLILDGTYSSEIDRPSAYLGFEVGERVAAPYQISNAVLAWAKQSDRMIVKEYAKSHEGRPLYAIFISSPENLSKLDEIKENKNVKWTEGKHKGYTLLKLTKDKSEVSFVYVNTVKSKIYEVMDNNKFNIKPNTPII